MIKRNCFSTIQFQAEEKNISLKYSVSLELASGYKFSHYDFSSLEIKKIYDSNYS